MVENGKDNGFTERRRGLHDLAHQIMCLRMEFQDVREHIENRLTSVEEWRAKADPVLQLMVKTMWVISGASVVLVSATAIVLWIWMQDHELLEDVARLTITNSATISQMQKIDDRLDSAVEKLRGNGNTGH